MIDNILVDFGFFIFSLIFSSFSLYVKCFKYNYDKIDSFDIFFRIIFISIIPAIPFIYSPDIFFPLTVLLLIPTAILVFKLSYVKFTPVFVLEILRTYILLNIFFSITCMYLVSHINISKFVLTEWHFLLFYGVIYISLVVLYKNIKWFYYSLFIYFLVNILYNSTILISNIYSLNTIYYASTAVVYMSCITYFMYRNDLIHFPALFDLFGRRVGKLSAFTFEIKK